MIKSMRILSAVSLSVLLLGGCDTKKAGMSAHWVGEGLVSEVVSFDGVEGDVCLGDGDATVISDSQLQRAFGEKSGGFVGKAETLDLKELRGQLDRVVADKTICDLKLKRVRKTEMAGEVMYEKYLESVLMVGKTYECGNPRCGKQHANIASGFMLTDDGVFVTNHHVAAGDFGGKAKGMFVMNGKGKMWSVEKVLAADKVNDFAILQLKGEGFKGLPIRGDVMAGEKIRAFTHPASHFFTMTEGIVARRYYMQGKKGQSRGASSDKNAWLNIDADYCKGSSGGPIIDRFGNVVGIVSSTNSIYYTVDRKTGEQKNLQMVFKNVPSAENFLKRIEKR